MRILMHDAIGMCATHDLISDNVNGVRTLSVGTAVSSVTLESCTSACFNAGYRFSGAEYSECVPASFGTNFHAKLL